MSFWSTSTGEQATGEVKENDDFAPLPKEWYTCDAEVSINEWQGRKSIKIKAKVIGDKYKNRVAFLSLKCWDDNEKKRDRALNVLVAMANAANIKLPDGEPDDAWCSRFGGRPVELLLDVYDFTNDKGEKIEGNWLVNARGVGKAAKVAPAKAAAPKAETNGGMDDDIPFGPAYVRAAWSII